MPIAPLKCFKLKDDPVGFIFVKDNYVFTLGPEKYNITMSDIQTKRDIRKFTVDSKLYVSCVFPKGNHLFAGTQTIGANNQIYMWDIQTGREIRRFPGCAQGVYRIFVKGKSPLFA